MFKSKLNVITLFSGKNKAFPTVPNISIFIAPRQRTEDTFEHNMVHTQNQLLNVQEKYIEQSVISLVLQYTFARICDMNDTYQSVPPLTWKLSLIFIWFFL